MFLLPALVALALVPLERVLAPAGETPLGFWLVCVLSVDVAHVWTTLYRTYLDRTELARRPGLYLGAPLAAYAFGVILASASFEAFWTGLAYVAVFHFIRQQYGWVRLYARKDPRTRPVDRTLDTLAIYMATGFPIVWWHAHLPRDFVWFLPGDFFRALVPPELVTALWPVYVGSLVAFVARQIVRRRAENTWPLGKMIVVLTTYACWGVGIIATNSDWAFTVTNVIIHGVPYFGIVWVYGRKKAAGNPARRTFIDWLFRGRHLGVFLGLVILLAYGEELLWDRTLWHGRPEVFFGPEWTISDAALKWWMPLLALPQLTHYILDGWIWRTRPEANPELGRVIALAEKT